MTLGEYAASLGHFTWLCLRMGWVVVVGTVLGRNLNPFSPRNLVIPNQIALASPKQSIVQFDRTPDPVSHRSSKRRGPGQNGTHYNYYNLVPRACPKMGGEKHYILYIYFHRIFFFLLYPPRIAFANCGHKLCKLYLI